MPVQVINGVGIAGIGTGSSSQSGGGSSSSFDTDAQAFITAASITATTQQNAVNDLVLDLKAANLWTKMKALYPMVGGTSSSHKWNLKDPRDLDAAYRLNFQGGWTHTSSGATPNGTNGYADTNLNDSVLTLNSAHISIYSRTNINGLYADIGAIGAANRETNIFPRYTDLRYTRIQALTNTAISNTDSRGLFISNRMYSTITKSLLNTTINNIYYNSIGNTGFNIYLGALNNNGTAAYNSVRQLSFASIGDGLTDLESTLFYQIVEKFQYALGRNVGTNKSFYFNRNYFNEVNAFLFNGEITDATQISATITLVSDLKTSGLWGKMKAIYPFVGGTSLSHRFNLKNAANNPNTFTIDFSGGWTHNSEGIQGNGTTAYANTNLVMAPTPYGYPQAADIVTLTGNSTHLSIYSRTNSSVTSFDMGTNYFNGSGEASIVLKWTDGNVYTRHYTTRYLGDISTANSDSTGFYLSNRASASSLKLIKNTSTIATNTYNWPENNIGNIVTPLFIGALRDWNSSGNPIYFSNRKYAFASIGDGLTDLESNLFYQIVEKFQVTLGRNINATQPFYYSSGYTNEINAFIFNGGITDATQISATNTLVSTLKTEGIWSKMKAVYPMVGGTALAHKFNLVNPVDSTSAYALTFNGGWTHTASGATPNGTTGYANTYFIPNTNLNIDSTHLSFYSRTSQANSITTEFGCSDNANELPSFAMYIKYNDGNYKGLTPDYNVTMVNVANSDSKGFYIDSRTANNSHKAYKNGAIFGTNTATRVQTTLPTRFIPLSAYHYVGSPPGTNLITGYSGKQCAFASIGDGLTDAEALTFYNAVQAFQTSLGRQV